MAGAIAIGFVVHAVIAAGWPDAVGEGSSTGGVIASSIDGWVVFPAEAETTVGNFAFVALLAAVLALTRLKGWYQAALVAPTLYLAAFVWETRLVEQPSVTRQLLFGATLVVMMAARPQGLLGTPRVEAV